jgi:hypothetical protein
MKLIIAARYCFRKIKENPGFMFITLLFGITIGGFNWYHSDLKHKLDDYQKLYSELSHYSELLLKTNDDLLRINHSLQMNLKALKYSTISCIDELESSRRKPVKIASALIDSLMPNLNSSLKDEILESAMARSFEYNLPPNFVISVMYRESRFNPKARSPVGALGLMQVLPKWRFEIIEGRSVRH